MVKKRGKNMRNDHPLLQGNRGVGHQARALAEFQLLGWAFLYGVSSSSFAFPVTIFPVTMTGDPLISLDVNSSRSLS